jgi:hypothetical protein
MKMKVLIFSISLISAVVLLSAIVYGAFWTEVYLTSEPSGAEVYLDGKKVGVTPLTVKIEGTKRDHKIEIRKEGYHSKVVTVFNDTLDCPAEWYPALITPRGIAEFIKENTLHFSLVSK